jgi:hypothetical protein
MSDLVDKFKYWSSRSRLPIVAWIGAFLSIATLVIGFLSLVGLAHLTNPIMPFEMVAGLALLLQTLSLILGFFSFIGGLRYRDGAIICVGFAGFLMGSVFGFYTYVFLMLCLNGFGC